MLTVANRLIGGEVRDTFIFDIKGAFNLSLIDLEFQPTKIPHNQITDFKSGVDVIDLRPIVVSGGHFLNFIGNKLFSSNNASGQVRFDVAHHQLLGSIDSDTDPEFTIGLLGVNKLVSHDIILK